MLGVDGGVGLPRLFIVEMIAGLSFVLISAVASTVMSGHAEEAARRVVHTLDVKNEVALLSTHLVDAEAGQRGYLLTGQQVELERYNESSKASRRILNQLRILMADNSSQQIRLDKITRLVESKLTELEHTIARWQQGLRQEVLETVSSVEGKGLMEGVRTELAEFEGEEDRLLKQQLENAAFAHRWLLGLILTGLASAILASGFAIRGIGAFIAHLRASAAALDQEIQRRQQAEATLVQVQKLEAVGQLTGSIAHDFNNLLTIVLGNLETLKRRIAAASPEESAQHFGAALQHPVEMATQAGQKGAQLVRQLLAYARQQPLAPAPVDLNRLVSGVSDLLQRTLGETVNMQVVLAGGLWPTFADANQIEAALLNLVFNARDAMQSGGCLTIETGNAYLDDAYVARFGDVQAGQYVLLSVTDTGTGIPTAVLHHVFEPFFTTKPAGKGTGLGLAMVHGFVKQSRGHVRIYSEAGKGTTVKIYLPRLLQIAPVPATPAPLRSVAERSPPGAKSEETVLLVEDDEGVRQYAGAALRQLGYRVLEASDGPTALGLLNRHSGMRIDILFTDVVLPGGMNGSALAAEMMRRRPGLAVLYTTGYTRNAIVHNGILDPNVQLITKPYTQLELARKVRGLLNQASPS